MTESNSAQSTLPEEAVTVENINLALKNLEGIEASMEALIEASKREENQSFAPMLLDEAVNLHDVAARLQATSPIQF